MNKPLISKPVLIIPRHPLPQEVLEGLVQERGGSSRIFFEETPFSDEEESLPGLVRHYQTLHLVGVLATLPRYTFPYFRSNENILALHDTYIPRSKMEKYDPPRREAAQFFNTYLHSLKRK